MKKPVTKCLFALLLKDWIYVILFDAFICGKEEP